jgi:hypothetical protein
VQRAVGGLEKGAAYYLHETGLVILMVLAATAVARGFFH